MAKIHINGAGNPGECHAEKQCPFGGDDNHYSTEKEARDAFEEKMNVDGQMFKTVQSGDSNFKPATKEELAASSDKSQKALDKTNLLKTGWLNQSDKGLIQKVVDGKKVSDEKIDSFLDRNFSVEKAGYSEDIDPKDVKDVFNHLRLIREQSQTPSTLTKLANFDPATQSVVGSTVRKSPSKMAKAITKSLNSVNHLQDLAANNRYTVENDDTLNEEAKAFYRGRAETHEEEAEREKVRADAILTEMKWKLENDTQFAWKADAKAVSEAKRFKLRSDEGKYSVGTVRAVKDEA